MDKLYRVGSEMEPLRGPSNCRALLPAEVKLCNLLGITAEEYFEFVENSELYVQARGKEYDIIPDIQNTGLEPFLVQIAIGLVLTGIGYLLVPKPKPPEEQKQPGNITLGGQRGKSRFAPVQGFDSVQELAELGDTIPLVFANAFNNGTVNKGGVRVYSSLLWSQLITEAAGQQLRAMFAFSNGQTVGVPNFEGFAIGDTLLNSYTQQRLSVYWRNNGGRIVNPQDQVKNTFIQTQLPSDVFGTFWDGTGQIEPFFCGARSVNTQTEFGGYSPMFNGTAYNPNYQLVLIPDAVEGDFKEDLKKRFALYTDTKEAGMKAEFTQGSWFSQVNGDRVNQQIGYVGQVLPGPGGAPKDEIVYRLSTYQQSSEEGSNPFFPNPLGFVNSSTNSAREAADAQVSLGELFLVGDKALGICSQIQSTGGSTNPFEPWQINPISVDKTFTFTITEPGNVQCGLRPGYGNLLEAEQNQVEEPFLKYDRYPLQRAAIATVTNTRNCEATELVIKSRVWRRVDGFADVNSNPDSALIRKYEEENGSISLGSLNKYIRRLSFFMLEVREAGTEDWIDITGNQYFFVEGNQPLDQYHYIRVSRLTPTQGQAEFRLRPVSGLAARFAPGSYKQLRYGYENSYASNGWFVVFNGRLVTVDENYAANREFILAPKSPTVIGGGGVVNGTYSPQKEGVTTEPGPKEWVNAPGGVRYSPPSNFFSQIISFSNPNFLAWAFYWDSSERNRGEAASQFFPAPGDWRLGQWQTQTSPFNPDIRYQWSLGRTPQCAGSTTECYDEVEFEPIQGWIRRVNREIYRQDFIPSGPGGETPPVDAAIVDAIPTDRTNGTGLKFYVRRFLNSQNQEGFDWFVDGSSPASQGTGYQVGDQVIVTFPGTSLNVLVEIYQVTSGEFIDGQGPTNLSRYDALLDIPSFDGVTASNLDGPEHAVVAINEKLAQQGPTYPEMTVGGLVISSSTEWQNFTAFSAYMKTGISLERLITNDEGASSLLPDIVYGLLTNKQWGAGDTVGVDQVDRDAMATASQYCAANDFTWDGVVESKINLREWIYTNAQFCLLDATIIGGRFALRPAVPTTLDGVIGNALKPTIKALFTDGNMIDMKIAFLSAEERQLFKAEMIWREEKTNAFPTRRQFTMFIKGTADDAAVETFDLSAFCTTQLHAARIAYYLLLIRKHVDHGITFKTTPAAAMNLTPGEYFRVASEITHTDRFSNGRVSPEGFVQSVDITPMADGTYDIVYWKPGTEGVRSSLMRVIDGKCIDTALCGTVFTLVTSDEQSRVYKLDSLTYSDNDGLVEVSGTHMPLTNIGSLKILDWNPNDFIGLGITL